MSENMPNLPYDAQKKKDAEYVHKNISLQSLPENKEACLLFVSLDMANSTSLKEKNKKWPTIIHNGLSKLKEKAKSEQIARTWKTVGDEVVFYKEIHKSLFLTTAPGNYEDIPLFSTTFNRLLELALEASDLVKEEVNLKGFPFKATAWIAHLERVDVEGRKESNSLSDCYNVFSKFDIEERRYSGILGQDIDTGFRISKNAHSSVLTISAELACVLFSFFSRNPGLVPCGGTDFSKCDSCKSPLRLIKFMGFNKYKGVWGGGHYPLFWYFPNNGHFSSRHELYHEPIENSLIRKSRNPKFVNGDNCFLKTPLGATGKLIDNIFEDVDKMKKVNKILQFIEANIEDPTKNYAACPPI
jgi:hypothetical protein